MMLHRMQDRGDSVVVTLKMQAHQLPDAQSRNVVAEVSAGWSPTRWSCWAGTSTAGTWARARWTMAAASVAAWEAVRLIHKLGLRPRRTIRVVLWTNEENGVEGGAAYLERHRDDPDQRT